MFVADRGTTRSVTQARGRLEARWRQITARRNRVYFVKEGFTFHYYRILFALQRGQ